MRLCLYLGTRGCPRMLEDALHDALDPLKILIPIEPALLGPNTDHDTLTPALSPLAEILAANAQRLAQREAQRQSQSLTDVFNQDPDTSETLIETHILDPPWLEGLDRHAQTDAPEACYIARDALEILNDAGQRPGDTLDTHNVPLKTR